MELSELGSQLRKVVLEISTVDLQDFYERLADPVLKYQETGARGKPVYDMLYTLWQEFEEDELKEEIITDLMSRIWGFCPPHRDIMFWDFDRVNKKWAGE